MVARGSRGGVTWEVPSGMWTLTGSMLNSQLKHGPQN